MKNFTLIFLVLLFSNTLYAGNDDSKISLDSIRSISQAIYRIKHNHVEDIDTQDLLNGCLAGMTSAADPESAFLDGE